MLIVNHGVVEQGLSRICPPPKPVAKVPESGLLTPASSALKTITSFA